MTLTDTFDATSTAYGPSESWAAIIGLAIILLALYMLRKGRG